MHRLDKATPEVGAWYQLPDSQTFNIIAMDADDQTIEIQYFDGAVEEWDRDDWERAEALPIEAPEDWSGAYDEMDYDIKGYDDFDLAPHHNGNPLDTLE